MRNFWVAPSYSATQARGSIELATSRLLTMSIFATLAALSSLPLAERQPVMLVESGPVGGCIGAGIYASALGHRKVIGFDMGGTTAKCALVEKGKFDVKPVYYVGGYDHGFPLRTPVLDIVEVGAGGGSIASVDSRGRLSVGPRSAGSTPGPACYARGGVEPTVTDANLALGRLDASHFLGGEMTLDAANARRAIARGRMPFCWPPV